MDAWTALTERIRELDALGGAQAVLEWDQQVYMPRGGSASRGEQSAVLGRIAHERFGRMIDTHTADGLKVAQEWQQPGVPMIVLETALPIKFHGNVRAVEGTPKQKHRTPTTPVSVPSQERAWAMRCPVADRRSRNRPGTPLAAQIAAATSAFFCLFAAQPATPPPQRRFPPGAGV